MRGNQLKAAGAERGYCGLDVDVGAYAHPLAGATGCETVRAQCRIGTDRVSFEHANRVAASQDSGEVVWLVHVVEQHREIGLAGVEDSPKLLITLRCHNGRQLDCMPWVRRVQTFGRWNLPIY